MLTSSRWLESGKAQHYLAFIRFFRNFAPKFKKVNVFTYYIYGT